MIALAEKRLEFQLELERYWERRQEFMLLNPAGEVPLLHIDGDSVIADAQAICEYADEVVTTPSIIGDGPKERAEARRLVGWFDRKFTAEVSDYLLREKFLKRFFGEGEPDAAAIRAGLKNLGHHLDYMDHLLQRRDWLAGDSFSIADISAAAQISCLDYLGDVPWEKHQPSREWYAKAKSRPSFRRVLGEHIAGMPPPVHYADPDF